ncbi:WYL domain-containing protein [Sphaerotilus sp.]|uniref:WYL domain-containing protein n=1 Tax=Sphaerotilus sp. TaxID=2093942 RepID=UPI002ACD8C77|nr:WYL domain-containing protein [Sphaerotilus sp.]
MEKITYYSRNGNKPPFEVVIQTDKNMVYVNCNCKLGVNKNICRHTINAVRSDKENRHPNTSDEVITRLKSIFGTSSAARLHLEEQWRLLREFSSKYPENEIEMANKRRILGTAFADGLLNSPSQKSNATFDAEAWEENRTPHTKGLNCLATLDYKNNDGESTTRRVKIEEIFISNSNFYLLGFCQLQQRIRTFRVDRIQEIYFDKEAPQREINVLLNIIFQGKIHQ